MIDNDAYLALAIFQKAFQPEGQVELSVDEFAVQHKREITEAGQVLAYLGLAQPDVDGELGWRSTRRLMNIVAERLLNPKPQEPADDDLTYHLLRDAVFGEDAEGLRGDLAFQLLRQLGLMQINDTGDWVTAKQLRKLFAAGYHKRHLEKAVTKATATNQNTQAETIRPKPVAAMH